MAKTEIEKLHEQIGLAINAAKKKMYRRNRDGAKPYDSMVEFIGEIGVSLPKLLKDNDSNYIATQPPDGLDMDSEQEPEEDPHGGYRRLTEEEIETAAELLADGTCGPFMTGLIVALLKHVLAVSIAEQRVGGIDHDPEFEVQQISKRLFAKSSYAMDEAIAALNAQTYQTLTRTIAECSGGAQ